MSGGVGAHAGAALALFAACVDPPVPAGAPEAPPAAFDRSVRALEAIDLDPDPAAVRYELLAAGDRESGYTYNGTSPGPVLRARLGDRVEVVLRNALDDPTTIHWHGVHVPNAADGVPMAGMVDGGMGAVEPGGEHTYVFTADVAGTFWYHPHFDTNAQIDLGLAGVFVVEDPRDPVVALDAPLVLDIAGEAAAGHDDHRRELMGAPWRVNGALGAVLEVDSGTTVRARFVNASSGRYAALRSPVGRLVATDQGVLPRVAFADRVVLGPGDRADFEWPIGAEPFTVTSDAFSAFGGDTLFEAADVLRVVPRGSASPPPDLTWAPVEDQPTPDPGRTDVVYALSGSHRMGDWRINGRRFPDTPLERAALGAEVVFEIRNLSAMRHPFHLHGMAFEVLSRGGIVPEVRTVEDTIDVGIHESVRLLVVADNPGLWMAHCHILPHAEGGMMALFEVGAP